MDAHVAAAIAELQPDAPIYASEIGADGSITLILPSKRLTWTPPSLREGAGGGKGARGGNPTPSTTSTPAADDFTAIPYVGKEIAAALRAAGYHTFHDLVKAPDTRLLNIPHVSAYTLNKIRTYLKEHYL